MNYYNENDPKAAAWLRELIRAGEIPPGDVDTRSITQISPHELTGYTQQHFFAGIGGWSLALKLAGWPADRPVRTGSCPCQPFSAAGKGMAEADARHLWPVFRDLITFGEPTITFGEQVASKAGRVWLARVRADLEGLGYGVGAADLCSAGVGSPNIRQRLYWMAYANSERLEERKERDGQSFQSEQQTSRRPDALRRGGVGGLGNAMRSRSLSGTHAGIYCREESAGSRDGEPERPGAACGVGDALHAGLQERISHPRLQPEALGTRTRETAERRSNPWDSFDLLPCTDGKARRIEPGSFPLAHGIPSRVGLLRGYGNAINPFLAAEFIQSSLEALNP